LIRFIPDKILIVVVTAVFVLFHTLVVPVAIVILVGAMGLYEFIRGVKTYEEKAEGEKSREKG